MSFWGKFREKLPIWGSRSAAVLVGATLLFELAHKVGLLSALHVPQDEIMEGLLVCALTLGLLSIEEFSKTEAGLETLAEKIGRRLDHTEQALDSLKLVVGNSLDATCHELGSLHDHQIASIEVAGFAGEDSFFLHWNRMLQEFASIVVWGRLGSGFTGEFKKLQELGRHCAYYLPIEEDSQDIAATFLLNAEEATRDAMRLFESGSFGNLAWIIGFDLPAERAAVLLCFVPLGDARFSGLYMTGSKAWKFHQCVLPRLEARGAPDQNSPPIRIYTQQQIESVVTSKVRFKQALVDVDKGEVMHGVEAVCEGMIDQLRQCRRFVDITHICSDETIPLLRSQDFRPWIEANYEAAKSITVTRIFLVPRALRSNPDLRQVIGEMRLHNVTVLVCESDDLSHEFFEDFSIYDERHVIYIDRSGGGPWVSKDDVMARRSDSWDRVNRFRTLFDVVKKRALQNSRIAHV